MRVDNCGGRQGGKYGAVLYYTTGPNSGAVGSGILRYALRWIYRGQGRGREDN